MHTTFNKSSHSRRISATNRIAFIQNKRRPANDLGKKHSGESGADSCNRNTTWMSTSIYLLFQLLNYKHIWNHTTNENKSKCEVRCANSYVVMFFLVKYLLFVQNMYVAVINSQSRNHLFLDIDYQRLKPPVTVNYFTHIEITIYCVMDINLLSLFQVDRF